MQLSQSFAMGYGGIAHDLRMCKGHGVRQNGIKERRFMNEVIVGQEIIDNNITEEEAIRNIVAKEIGDKLAVLNEKQIANGHSERVQTIEQFIQKQQYVKNGKPRRILHEFIIQLGDKRSGCPFIMQNDNNGNILDNNGRIIPEWDTRRNAAYKDNTITESEQCKLLKQVYRRFAEEFIKVNTHFIPVCITVHADENGGVHAHIAGIFKNEVKNSVGIGFSATSALKQQYKEQGIKTNNTRFDNAMNMWRKDMRALLEKVALEFGIERMDMNNKEKHKTIKEYAIYADKRCETLEKIDTELQIKEAMLSNKEAMLNQKELELSADIAKQEWYWLKKNYPDMYAKVHDEFLQYRDKVRKNNKKIVNNALDKSTNVHL